WSNSFSSRESPRRRGPREAGGTSVERPGGLRPPPSRGIMKALLGPLRAVLRTALLAVLHALRVEHAAQHVVAHARKVAHTAAADQHHGVLLQVVPLAGDVGDDFALVGQADLGHLAQ